MHDNGGKREREDADGAPEKRARGETLSAGQRRAIEIAAAGKSLALLGPAGTGKSLTVRHIRDALVAKHAAGRVAVTASTGAAAFLVGGRTLHSFAGTGAGEEPQFGIMYSKATRREDAVKRWADTDVLIVDEISMVNAAFWDLLSRIAQRNRGNRRPFGGMQVIVVGDFYQLAPVRGAHAFAAECWDRLFGASTVVLTEVFRQRDPVFVAALHALRTNALSDEQRALLAACDSDDGAAVRLFVRNKDADAHNAARLAALAGPPSVYVARDAVDDSVKVEFPVEPRIELRVGARVMLRANVHVDAGLVNGACGVVVQLGARDALVEFDCGQRARVEPYAFKIDVAEPGGRTRTAQRTQVPLILAWAISVHKAQGTTLAAVRAELAGAWADGQVYVALSRAATREGLCVRGLDRAAIKASAEVRRFYEAAAAWETE